MSKPIGRRIRHFVGRVFSRNRHTLQSQSEQESERSSVRSQNQQNSNRVLQDTRESGAGKHSCGMDHPSDRNFAPIESDKLSSFENILDTYIAGLVSIRARLEAVRESHSFKLCIHCIAYRLSLCQRKLIFFSSHLKHSAELARLGFCPLDDKDVVSEFKEVMEDLRAEEVELADLLDQASRLGLGQNVHAVKRACKINLEVRRLALLSELEQDYGGWDLALMYVVKAFHLIDEMHRVCPLWSALEQSRQAIMEPVQVYGYDDCTWEAEELLLRALLRVSYYFIPTHGTAADVCRYVKFESQSLNGELSQMSGFITERSADSDVQAVAGFMAASETEFCELSIELFEDSVPELVTDEFGLRLYRMCLRMKEWDLADTAVKLRFVENPDQQQVMSLLQQLLTKLRDEPAQLTDGVELRNCAHGTVDYKLPELLPVMKESPDEEPWWINVFRQRTQYGNPVREVLPTGLSANSAATTCLPSTSLLRKWEESALKRVPNAPLPDSENRDVALLFLMNDCIRDYDTYTTHFSYVSAVPENPVTLIWKDRDGDHERKTNMAMNVPHHCRVLTYHPVEDEWSIRSDMCRISGSLTVEQQGATCVPFVGDSGELLRDDGVVFKIHISMSKYALLKYMADVRTQSTALWYVSRFRKMTQDRFGVLTMLQSDCVIVYQDKRRDTILELMTREKNQHRPVGSNVKFDKFTSNASYRNKKVNTKLAEAFSHFTHHESKGTLIVADLQGWVAWDSAADNLSYVLTDPVIHCPGLTYRFGGGNREYAGIQYFFRNVHPTCNHICKSLNLTRPGDYLESVAA